MEPRWTMSKRMKARERRRYQEMERELTPGPPSSPSESAHSVSRSVSNSQLQNLPSNIKSSQKNNGIFDDDISETSHSNVHPLTHSQNICKEKVPATLTNLVSPDIMESSKFKFKEFKV